MKAQAFYSDFVIAVTVFSLVLIFFYNLLPNIREQETDQLRDIYTDAARMSGNLITDGYPTDWGNDDVLKIGIMTDGQLDKAKFDMLGNISRDDYYRAKRLLGSKSDFLVYLKDQRGRLMRIGDFYFAGNSDANWTDDAPTKRMAYYANPGSDMHAEMGILSARTRVPVTKYDSPGLIIPDLNLYDLVLIENASLTDAQTAQLDSYVSSGKAVFLSDVVNRESQIAFNATFTHEDLGVNATVTAADTYLDLEVGQSLEFPRNNTVNGSISSLAMDSNLTSAARWRYGQGMVFYISTFDAPGMAQIASEGAEQYLFHEVINASLDLSNIDGDSIASISRVVLYSRKPMTMAVMAWR